MPKAKRRESTAPDRLRLKLPGWRRGEFIRRVNPATPKRTYDDWRNLLQDAYRDSFVDVLDAIADEKITLAKAYSLKTDGGFLAVRRHLQELATAEAEQARQGNFVVWLAEFRTQPRANSSLGQHAKIAGMVRPFLGYLAKEHGLQVDEGGVKRLAPERVTAALWTKDNMAAFANSYIKTSCAETKQKLEAEWAAMADPPSKTDRDEILRKDAGRKLATSQRYVNAVGAFSQWLMSLTPPRISVDPAIGNRISVKRQSMHRDDDHRSLEPEQLKGVLKWSAVLDEENPGRKPWARPDTLWYSWLVASGATTYTEGARLRPKDIRIADARRGLVPAYLSGSKGTARKRWIYIPQALAEALLERAAARGVRPNRAIFDVTARRGSDAWARLMRLIAARDPELHGQLEGATPYAFRHTYAVRLLRKGVDLKQLQRLMGHGNLSTTAVYLNHTAPPYKALARAFASMGM